MVSTALIFSGLPNISKGDATWYNAGLGTCGVQNRDTDFVVALSTLEFNHGVNCGRRIQVHHHGRAIDATVVDLCPGCSHHGLDLSPAAFRALAPLSVGRINVNWNYT